MPLSDEMDEWTNAEAIIEGGLRGRKRFFGMAAFRCAAGLLAPEEIRRGREKLGLTQKQFANMLGVGDATISRWETGAQIQQRAMDRFLRVCLASPAAVELLRTDFRSTAKGA